MGLVKVEKQNLDREEFNTLDECLDYFYQPNSDKNYAINSMLNFSNGANRLVSLLKELEDRDLLSYIGAKLAKLDPKVAPIDDILELLKLENAFVRNLAISILRDYSGEIKYYIVKYLIGDDRDLRIFAVNILGDVKFAESRDMLIELLEKEQDINVAMTAIDYIAEIGKLEDIALLEKIKNRFSGEYYASFAIDNAIASIKKG